MALLVPNEKQDCLGLAGRNLVTSNDLAYHPGQVSPASGDGSPLKVEKATTTRTVCYSIIGQLSSTHF